MTHRLLSTLITLLALLALAPPLDAKSLAVLADGRFDEWGRRKPRVTDPSADGAIGGLDLGRLWLADDGEALFLRLEVGRETLLQNSSSESAGNLLRLYLDTDGKKATGTPVSRITRPTPWVTPSHTYSKWGVPPRITEPSVTTAS